MKALALNCTLKPSPATSNTEALARVVLDALEQQDVDTEIVRVVDHDVKPGVSSDEAGRRVARRPREDPRRRDPRDRDAHMARQALEHRPAGARAMDAMLSEEDDEGRPVAYNRVAGVVVTGNEDGAHHVIGEVAGGLNDIGFTIPGQAWTYWNRGPGPGGQLPGVGRRQGLVALHRPDRRGEPRGCGTGARRAPHTAP